MYVLYALKLKL